MGRRKGSSYRLENVLAIYEIQGSEYKSCRTVLVTFHPTLTQQIPLWLEIPTQHATETRLQGCQQYSNAVVTRRLCQLRIACIVELERVADG